MRGLRPLVASTRFFSADAVTATETEQQTEETSIEALNQRVGADQSFNEKKHAYVLQFPWNFENVLEEAEEMSLLAESSYWHKFMVNTRSIVDYNNLYREFHQACAIPDY